MRRLRSLLVPVLVAVLFAAFPAGSTAAQPARPSPLPGATGRWLKLPAGRAFRPDVAKGWQPYRDGRFRIGPDGPEWQGSAAWETFAARNGTWSRVATWGWVYWPGRASTRSARVLFVALDSPRAGVAFVPLGPRDDEAWLEALEKKRARLGSLPLQNGGTGGAFRFVPRDRWPDGASERLRRRPRRGTIVPPSAFLAREGAR